MQFALFGICLDRKKFRRGSEKAPIELRKIFTKLETFINGVDLQDHILHDFGNIEPKNYEEITSFISKRKKEYFSVILGGDHSITFGAVNAIKPENFVSFDAHPDCEPSELSSHSVTRKIAEKGYKTYLYGLRCFSRKEMEYLKNGKVKVVTPKDLKLMNGPTYLSIDFDVLDPSIMPSVAWPEPNGLTFSSILEAVRNLSNNLVAIDFVELIPERATYTLIAGKLIYSILAEIVKAKLSQ
jgi:agmatinase